MKLSFAFVAVQHLPVWRYDDDLDKTYPQVPFCGVRCRRQIEFGCSHILGRGRLRSPDNGRYHDGTSLFDEADIDQIGTRLIADALLQDGANFAFKKRSLDRALELKTEHNREHGKDSQARQISAHEGEEGGALEAGNASIAGNPKYHRERHLYRDNVRDGQEKSSASRYKISTRCQYPRNRDGRYQRGSNSNTDDGAADARLQHRNRSRGAAR